MIRRDEFIQKLHEYNSTEYIERELDNLEKFVDTELSKEENIIKMINSISAGSNGTSGEEYVNVIIPTNSVHKDINAKGDENITLNKISYAIFEEEDTEITLNDGKDATETPWDDITLLEADNFDGYLDIELPVNTNKMVAQKLVEKYLKADDFETDESDGETEPSSGFWSKAPKPNDSNNDETGTDLNDAVSLIYYSDTNLLVMMFKLF